MAPETRPYEHREPLLQRGVGAVAWTPGIRLPPGTSYQFCGTGQASIRYLYSGVPTAVLQTVVGGVLSIVNVHPGPNVYVQVQAAPGVDVMFLVT